MSEHEFEPLKNDLLLRAARGKSWDNSMALYRLVEMTLLTDLSQAKPLSVPHAGSCVKVWTLTTLITDRKDPL